MFASMRVRSCLSWFMHNLPVEPSRWGVPLGMEKGWISYVALHLKR